MRGRKQRGHGTRNIDHFPRDSFSRVSWPPRPGRRKSPARRNDPRTPRPSLPGPPGPGPAAAWAHRCRRPAAARRRTAKPAKSAIETLPCPAASGLDRNVMQVLQDFLLCIGRDAGPALPAESHAAAFSAPIPRTTAGPLALHRRRPRRPGRSSRRGLPRPPDAKVLAAMGPCARPGSPAVLAQPTAQ